MMDILFSTDELENKQVELENELNVVAGLIDNIIKENAKTIKNQDEYKKNYTELVLRFENTQSELDKLVKEITERIAKKDLVSIFLKSLEKQELIDSFDEEAWHSLAPSITIYKNGDKKVKFLDGTEVEL